MRRRRRRGSCSRRRAGRFPAHQQTQVPAKVCPDRGRSQGSSGLRAQGRGSRSSAARPPRTPAEDPASQKTTAESRLLTCAADEQQPPEQLRGSQHHVPDLLLDAEAGGRGGQSGAFLRDNDSRLPGGFLVLVAPRVRGTMTDRQQPKHALTHTRALGGEATNYSARSTTRTHTRGRAQGAG